jgi:hypothetical protein
MLKTVAFALETTLHRVPEDSVHNETLSESWRKAEEWCRAVRKFTARTDDETPFSEKQLGDIPPFPLTSKELTDLREAIERMVEARDRVPGTLKSVSLSSTTLGWVLGIGAGCATLAAINILVFHTEIANANMYVLPGLLLSWLGFGVWAFVHFLALGQHRATLQIAGVDGAQEWRSAVGWRSLRAASGSGTR